MHVHVCTLIFIYILVSYHRVPISYFLRNCCHVSMSYPCPISMFMLLRIQQKITQAIGAIWWKDWVLLKVTCNTSETRPAGAEVEEEAQNPIFLSFPALCITTMPSSLHHPTEALTLLPKASYTIQSPIVPIVGLDWAGEGSMTKRAKICVANLWKCCYSVRKGRNVNYLFMGYLSKKP